LYLLALSRAVPAEREVQRGIEDDVRTRAGRWLNEHMAEDEWLCCECLGYLGYYSSRPMLDFPGLACPRSVAALREYPKSERTLINLIDHERPDWLALRPSEVQTLQAQHPQTFAQYVERARFQADPAVIERLGRWLWVDARGVSVDTEFIIFERRDRARSGPG
jgi:hypothetical protein